MPTFGAWERTVLGATWELVDEVSLHAYYEEGDDLAGFLGSAVALDRQIEEVAAVAGEVVARAGGEKRIGLAVDEWNVWYLDRHRETFHPFDWPEAPAICEDAYTVADAVVVGSLLISLLRHADVVTTACLAQLVNTIASIKTEPGGPAWRETTYYPFARTAGHAGAGAEAVRVELAAPVIETARHGNVPIVDAVATRSDDTISLFAVNRHVDEPVDLRVGLADPAGLAVVDAVVMGDPDAHATNTRQQPERVRLRPLSEVALEQELRAILPPVSWSHVRLRVRSDSRGVVR
jgi:alpha-N-arabinofuranosidase